MRLEAEALPGLPEVAPGDALGKLIANAATSLGGLAAGDLLVISQKIVSKADGRLVELAAITPGGRAVELAKRLGKDPRLVELVLAESRELLRAERGVLIVETHSGVVCANAGIDASNVPGRERVALLPADPDASARALRAELAAAGAPGPPAVVISDSIGRAWRLGQAEVAIGCAGLLALDDRRGERDRQGRELTATQVAIADQAAAAADLVRGKRDGLPVVRIRGLERWVGAEDGPGAAALQRPRHDDLFR